MPWDVSIETTDPKLDLLPSLVTDKTVAIIIAHIFGKWCDMDPIIDAARKYNLPIIEDCAEAFYGFEHLGNPRSDLSLFSFGIIKFFTAFGGSVAKVKDENVYRKMVQLYDSFPLQRRTEYLKKICKVFLANLIMGSPHVTHLGMYVARLVGFDHKSLFINMLRGFPDEMLKKIKMRPNTALLMMLRHRLKDFSQSDYDAGQVKCEYLRMRLPEEAQLVGMKAKINNYWLFPILVVCIHLSKLKESVNEIRDIFTSIFLCFCICDMGLPYFEFGMDHCQI